MMHGLVEVEDNKHSIHLGNDQLATKCIFTKVLEMSSKQRLRLLTATAAETVDT